MPQKGKHRVLKRNVDAARALRGLKLGVDPEEFDFHFMHTHVIWMGDLNYRIPLAPEKVLRLIQNSAFEEQNRYMQEIASQSPGKMMVGDPPIPKCWREARYQEILTGKVTDYAMLGHPQFWGSHSNNSSWLERIRNMMLNSMDGRSNPNVTESFNRSLRALFTSHNRSATQQCSGMGEEHDGEEFKNERKEEEFKDPEKGVLKYMESLVSEEKESSSDGNGKRVPPFSDKRGASFTEEKSEMKVNSSHQSWGVARLVHCDTLTLKTVLILCHLTLFHDRLRIAR